MPVVASRMRPGGYPRAYDERELTGPVDLCDAGGRLNEAAVGWSRRPLVRANLRGHWPRKKRWDFWNWIGPRFVFSVTVADIDYAAFCQMTFTDFETGRSISTLVPARPGSVALPEHPERTVKFARRGLDYATEEHRDHLTVRFAGRAKSGERVTAALLVHRPPAHESVNVVVPWSPTRFQLNSKWNTLRCEGTVTVDGRRYEMDPRLCHAVRDFGRGVWPYRSFWNWGVATGEHDGTLIGVNVGGKWTTGTGVNENGLCIDGRVSKIMEDLVWRYDPDDWQRPWHVCATRSGMVDLTLVPVAAHRPRVNVGVLRTAGVCAFGAWHGTIRVDGRQMRVRDLVGWAEEFSHRW